MTTKFKFENNWTYATLTEARCNGMSCQCSFAEGQKNNLYFKVQADLFQIATFYAPWVPWYDFQTKHDIYIRPPGEASGLVATFISGTFWTNTDEVLIGPVAVTPKNAGTMNVTVISYYRYRTWPWWWSEWQIETAHVWEEEITVNPVSEE